MYTDTGADVDADIQTYRHTDRLADIQTDTHTQTLKMYTNTFISTDVIN